MDQITVKMTAAPMVRSKKILLGFILDDSIAWFWMNSTKFLSLCYTDISPVL